MSAAKTDPLRGMVGGLVCVDLSQEPVLQFVDERLTEQMGLPAGGHPPAGADLGSGLGGTVP